MSIFMHKTRNEMNRIKEVLNDKGVKQTWLAERLGKSFNIVNDYCNNKRQPKLEVLFEIAELLNVEVKELIKENKK
jgi:transcriptional regulator with XRE-family HTH domain